MLKCHLSLPNDSQTSFRAAMVQWTTNNLLAVLAHTRFMVAMATFLLTLYTRSLHVIYFGIGSCLTAMLAKVLKHVWKQPRPYGQKGYGMPSTHSQVIMYFATYFQCVGCQTMSWSGIWGFLFAASVVWSRVQLKHHTVPQVMVGTCIGILAGLVWYHIGSMFLHRVSALIINRSSFFDFVI